MKEKLRIGFLIGSLDMGGTEKQLVQLCQKLNQEKFAPEVYCMVRKGLLAKILEGAGIPVFSLGMRGIRYPLEDFQKTLQMAHLVKKRRIQLLVGALPQAVVLGALVSRLANIPRYLSWRRSSECLQTPRLLPYLQKASNHFTRLVIANSEAVKNEAVKNERLSEAKIRVIHNGVEMGSFGGLNKEQGRKKLRLESHQPIVGVLANFTAYKGHTVFLEAWKDVIKAFPHAMALLIGSGPTFEQIKTLASTSGLINHLCFMGTRLDVPEILSAIDVLVHPSLLEGFSNAILEGMAAGKPVIASAIGGNPEAVVHEQTGILVPQGDAQALSNAVITLLNDPAKAQRMGDLGRERASKLFPFLAMVQEYETVFESVSA